MNTISKSILSKSILFFSWLWLSACQGPWSYWPEDPENYRGIFVYAHVVSGRPITNLCFEKLLELDEAYVPFLPFFDSAQVQIQGQFSGQDTTFTLTQNSQKPNCFEGPLDLTAQEGFPYTLQAQVHWDSAGSLITTSMQATTTIPRQFKITQGLAPAPAVMENALTDPRVLAALQKEFGDTLFTLMNDTTAALSFFQMNSQRISAVLRSILTPYAKGDTVYYMDPPNDLLSHYFIPQYSADVGGVLITQVFDTLNVATGPTTFDTFFGQTIDTLDRVDVGDRHRLSYYWNESYGDIGNAIDSLAVNNVWFKIGKTDFLLYATTTEYADYLETAVYSSDDSRIKPKFNIEGGAGIFAGMLVDTFSVYTQSLPGSISYPYMRARTLFCRDTSWSTPYCRHHLPAFCSSDNYQASECWPMAVKASLDSGLSWNNWLTDTVPSDSLAEIRYEGEKRWCMAHNFPDSLATCQTEYQLTQESSTQTPSMEYLWNWCQDRQWPIDQHPQCGTALVSWTRINKLNSNILERKINQWCNTNTTDPQCALR